MRTTLKNTLKLTLAALFLLAVGWSIILFNGSPTAPVKEAQADIAMLDFAPKTKQARFVEGLQELGMEKPRSYDWNGNKVFFSMMRTKDTPQEVLRKAHKIYKDKGLNKDSRAELPPDLAKTLVYYSKHNKLPKSGDEVRADVDASIAYYNDFFTGGLVPIINDTNHIMMAGGEGHGPNIKDVASYLAAQRVNKRSVIEQVKSMHVLEATRQPGDVTSLVTAVWSDSDLDMRRFMNEGENVSTNPDLPTCPGCSRLMALGGETGHEQNYVSTSFVASEHSSRDALVSFYDRSLGSRGWRRMEASILLDKLRSRKDIPTQPPAGLVGYSRGDQFLTVDISQRQGATLVQLMQSP
jgi:hypothetical protein